MKINFRFTLLFFVAISLVSVMPVSATEKPAEFSLPDMEGRIHNLSDYRGKWVLVNYWATWCPPCLEEIPELSGFHERHKDKDAVVLGVNMEDISVDDLRQFSDSLLISYPVLRSRPLARTELGAIPGMPTSYLISPDGEIVATQVGVLTGEALESFIEQYPADVAAK
ncbi:MAG: TlpA family protein disulfide reductase [gamma proteobacterium symbiont of Bathyaustriella thionipta]|nr:TlpA family protein disulfide reductase [gamma proteobacterium symbiont of Bathyaustriella thionipta]